MREIWQESIRAHESPLVGRAVERARELPLASLREAGFYRDRGKYFLNISYPSLQAMSEVSAAGIYPPAASGTGRRVALYVHMPFCTAECYYCHYYKKFGQSSGAVDTYLGAIDRELELYQRQFGGLEAVSVYVGGGTPSYLNPDQIDRLLGIIKAHTSIQKGAEVCFEMHPESTTAGRVSVLVGHGVNRVSIGVESFEDRLLKAENRRHTAQEAVAAFERVRGGGIANVNLDLIYGLRGQDLSGWEYNLDRIAVLQPTSATMYYLRLKTGTPEYKLWQADPKSFPSDEELMLMHIMSFEKMEGQLGYTQSPVDWFIRDPSFFHTYQDYNWRRSDETPLLGVGASAYSAIDGWQYYNVNDTGRYQAALSEARLPIWRGEHLPPEERMRRTVMLGIKMGIDRSVFRTTYGVDVVDAFESMWWRLSDLGLVVVTDQMVDLTYTGKLFADEVGQVFYSAAMKKRMEAVDPHLISTTWPQFNR